MLGCILGLAACGPAGQGSAAQLSSPKDVQLITFRNVTMPVPNGLAVTKDPTGDTLLTAQNTTDSTGERVAEGTDTATPQDEAKTYAFLADVQTSAVVQTSKAVTVSGALEAWLIVMTYSFQRGSTTVPMESIDVFMVRAPGDSIHLSIAMPAARVSASLADEVCQGLVVLPIPTATP